MNLFGYSIVVRIFFVFTLLCMCNAAHANRFSRIGLDFDDGVKNYLEQIVGVDVKNVSRQEAEFLVRTRREPALLVDPSDWGLFKSESYRNLFFRNFDFPDGNKSLFKKLFYKQTGEGIQELPFDEAKRNWENFIDALEQATLAGHTRIQRIDVEAAAISFIRKNSYESYLYEFDIIDVNHMLRADSGSYRETLAIVSRDLDHIGTLILQNPAPEGTLLYIFRDLHSFDTSTYFRYYASHHFQLPIDDPYHFFIVREILKDSSVPHTKESILKIWTYIVSNPSENVMDLNKQLLSSRLANTFPSNIYPNRSGSGPTMSIEGSPFLMAVSDAAEDNDMLLELFNRESRRAMNRARGTF